MAQYVVPDGFDVLRRDVAAAVEERVGLGREGEIDGGTGRGTVADHPVKLEAVGLRLATGPDDIDDVVLHPVVDVDTVDDFARADDLLRGDQGIDPELRRGSRHGVEDGTFLGARGVADMHLEHEAVELRLGQLVGALLLERIHRGEHEEWVGQFVSLVPEGDLALLHGFKQGALHFGRGAIDFVSEDEIGKNRPQLGRKFAVTRVVDQRADQVGREKVGGKLQTGETGVQARGEGAHGQRLGQPGHALKEDVTIGQETHDQALDKKLLPHHHFTHFGEERLHPLAAALHLFVQFVR